MILSSRGCPTSWTAAACCVLLLLTLPVSGADYATIVQYTELVNTSFDMSDWANINGVTAKYIQHSNLTNGAYTLQGRPYAFTDTGRVATVAITLDNITLSNGHFVMNQYFPVGSTVTLTRIHGTVAANKPLIDASALSFIGITMTVKNDNVVWPAVETVFNTQVLVHTPGLIAQRSAIFVLNTSITSASAVVGLQSAASLVVSAQSLIAVDYTNCSGCSGGFLRVKQAALAAHSGSLLRVSRSLITDAPAGTALVDVGGAEGTVTLATNSLLLVENVTLPSCNVFSARDVTTQSRSAAVLRYVSANSVGATMDAGASYKLLELAQTVNAELSAAVPIAATACAAACVLPATVDERCSCVCPAGGTVDARYMNLCTYVPDAALAQYPDACAAGCAACTAASAGSCTVCREGYSLRAGDCYQEVVGCPGNCAQCTATGVCQECSGGYALSSTKECVACRVSDCEMCSTSLDTCNACKDGYSIFGGTCEQSCLVEHCASCVTSSNTECATCVSGYKKSRSSTCDDRGDASAGLVRVPLATLVAVLVALCLS